MKWLLALLPMILLDIYGFQAFKALGSHKSWTAYGYWFIHLVVYASWIGFTLFHGRATVPVKYAYLYLSILFTLYTPKLIIILFLIMEDASRWVIQSLMIRSEGLEVPQNGVTISRAKFISQMAIGLASLPFAGLIYAMVKGKYNFQVRKVQIALPHLPEAFHGFKITHISDFHIGSFESKEAVARGIKLINDQQSDVIFFTGDLVNDDIREVTGYEDILSSLSAPNGVFSTLGNHDYGHYSHHIKTEEDWAIHHQQMLNTHKAMGWNLLMNQHHIIERDGDQLAVIGVENWSRYTRFPRLGKLHKALAGLENIPVKLLLSHDPSHWEDEVLPESDVDITFSGHTHGCQFGIEIPGIKWSPIQYVYAQWAGLYEKNKRYIYVNRGFGFAGFSGRLGIPPEITVMELVKA